MKIYTRTGDKGTTGLFGGGRVPKDHLLIRAYGTVDEVNALVGMVRSHLPDNSPLDALLRRLQEELFILGADLATPLDAKPVVPRITTDHIEQLENDIDRLTHDLPPLKRFILPGGSPAAASLHLARTVSRRAERLTVAADQQLDLSSEAVVYLNRLSDLFFTLARTANLQADKEDIEWSPPPPADPGS